MEKMRKNSVLEIDEFITTTNKNKIKNDVDIDRTRRQVEHDRLSTV